MKIHIVVALISAQLIQLTLSACMFDDDIVKIENVFVEERKNFLHTGVPSVTYEDLISRFRLDRNTTGHLPRSVYTTTNDADICVTCRMVMSSLLHAMRSTHESQASLRDEMVALCILFNFQDPKVCPKLVDIYIATIYFILENRPLLTAETVCGVIIQSGLCELNDPLFDFSVDISPGAQPITGSKPLSANPGNILKIVHITDIHYSPSYSPGSNAICEGPSCCRLNQGTASIFNLENGAGAWGDYRSCDSPWSAVEDMLDQVQTAHLDADMIYFTGDIVDHGVWETSIEGNKDVIKKLYYEMSRKFGSIPVFPVLGNRDAHPNNMFAPSYIKRQDLSSQWFYEFHSNIWQLFLPNSVTSSLQEDGCYTVLARPGLRLIVLNNSIAMVYNLWVLYDPQYLLRQLQWLNFELALAEAEGEKVHLLYHVPNGDDALFKVWAREFRRLVERYWDTISAQFTGHTHADSATIFYSLEHPEFAIGASLSGGSTTTYGDVNPSYQAHFVDDANFEIRSKESIYYNLTEANLSPYSRPSWKKMYDTFAFGLPDLSPASLDKLVHQFAKNRTLLQHYWMVKKKLGDSALAKGCDDECLRVHMCQFATSQFNDQQKCDELSAIFWGHQDTEQSTETEIAENTDSESFSTDGPTPTEDVSSSEGPSSSEGSSSTEGPSASDSSSSAPNTEGPPS